MLSAAQVEDRHVQQKSQHKRRPAHLTKPRTEYRNPCFPDLQWSIGHSWNYLLSRGQTPNQVLGLYEGGFQPSSEMGTSDGSLKPAKFSSEVDLKYGEVDNSPAGQVPQEKGWILPLSWQLQDHNRKLFPKMHFGPIQVLWISRGKCGEILTVILRNEPIEPYIPDPLSNGLNYNHLMLKFLRMGLSSQTETYTQRCLHTKMSNRANSGFTESTTHRIFCN